MNEKNLLFIKEKIDELESALFVSMSDAVLKFPSGIISVLKVDDVSQIWFLIPKPKQSINEFDKEFYSKLNFYKKGKNFFLNVEGKAYLINDPEEINSLLDFSEEVRQRARESFVLVKFRISKVDYYESRMEARINRVERVKELLNQWLFQQRPGYRPYKFDPDTLVY